MEFTTVKLRLGLTIALMATVLVLSIIPGEAKEGDSALVWAVAMTPTHIQKLAHVLCYAGLACLWAWTLEPMRSVRLRFTTALVVSVGFGILMEIFQVFVPGRFATLFDVALNAGGALLGSLTVAFLIGSEDAI